MTVRIRPASAADFELYVRLLPELEVDDPPPTQEKWRTELMPQTSIAEVNGAAVGFCWWQRLEGSGYVRQIVTDPSVRRTGAARALLEHVANELRAAKCTTWRLNVKPQNTAALALYASLGFRREYGSVSLKVEWPVLERLAPSSAEVRVVTPGEDGEVEAAFALPAGQLAGFRPQRVLLQAFAEGQRVGFAAFNPHYPGAFPFRVPVHAHARAVLEAMRAHSLPGATYCGVVVEGDDALVEVLKRAGAGVRMVFEHQVGTLGRVG